MTTLGDLEFKADDFLGREEAEYTRYSMASYCNKLLRAKLEKAPEVFGVQLRSSRERGEPPNTWTKLTAMDTHRARLVCIEPIAGEKE